MEERINRIKDLTGKKFGNLTVLSMHKERIKKKIYWLCKCDCEFQTEFLVQGNNLTSGNTTRCKLCSSKSKIINLIGQKFDRLVVEELIGTKNKNAVWKCKCECGNYVIKNSYELKHNVNNSCGCLDEEKNLVSKVFGKLTVLEKSDKRYYRSFLWKCECSCENKTIIYVSTPSLKSGNTKSCGCLHAESMKIMGESIRQLNEYDLSGEYGIGYTSKGEEFYFDLEDYDKIKRYTWSYNPDNYVISNPFGKIIRMNMLIMDSSGEKDIDHKNHITYDNRKNNLRICEHFENIIHSKTYSNNTSGRKGVYWDKSREKWMAAITYNKKKIHLGRFNSFDEAVNAREIAEKQYHKEFICII